jgi:hypothetical protein
MTQENAGAHREGRFEVARNTSIPSRTLASEVGMKRIIPWMIRQGDVLMIAVDAIPNDAVEQPRDESDRVVLAYGEATGHGHALHEPGVAMLRAANQEVFLRVLEPSTLVHEEHDRIAIPPGLYRVVRQREWSDADKPTRVAD